MQVRLIRPWQFRKVGRVMDLPDGVANMLINRGVVVLDTAEQMIPQVETACKVTIDDADNKPRKCCKRVTA